MRSALLSGLAVTLTAVLVVPSTSAQMRAAYFHTDEMPNAINYLPPPPDSLSVHYAYDMSQYFWGKSIRGTERGEMAVSDVNSGTSYFCSIFSEPMGLTLSEEETPEIYTLLSDALSTTRKGASLAKDYYARRRPYERFNEPTASGETPGPTSYPSGHAVRGWAAALILVEINPECQDAILKRGYEYGQSRVIVGAHWQSDVDAGRVVASACFARLHTNTEYLQQLERAKDEFRQKSGQVITDVPQLVIDDESDADDPDMGSYTLDGRRATPQSQGLIIRNRKVTLRP